MTSVSYIFYYLVLHPPPKKNPGSGLVVPENFKKYFEYFLYILVRMTP